MKTSELLMDTESSMLIVHYKDGTSQTYRFADPVGAFLKRKELEKAYDIEITPISLPKAGVSRYE